MMEMARNDQVLSLGTGKVVVSHGFHGGYPCLWFAAAKTPGEAGAPALTEDMEGAFCLRFENMPAIEAHVERVFVMVEDLEKALRAQEEMNK